MKFVFITDSHVKVRGPASRTDNMAEAVLRKYREVGEVAKKIGATAVLHGGDLFDGPRVADSLKGDLGKTILSWPCPLYVVPGNHDLFGYAISSLQNTSLGLLFKHGIAKPLTRAGGPVTFTEGSVSVAITGQEYHHQLDAKGRDPGLDYWVEEDLFATYRILLIHSMLLPQPFIPDQNHTLIADVPVDTPTSPDLIMVGHYHPGWPTVTRGALRPTTFMNIGSMLRTDAGHDNMNRDPQYAILDVTKNGIKVTTHKFTCALPSSVILNRTARDAANTRAKTLEQFRQNVDQNANLKGNDVVSIMDNIIASEGLAQSLRDSAIDRMEQAETLVEDEGKKLDNYVEKPGPHHITHVEAVNFQSWEKLSVDFAGGLNVIVGPSDQGKSAILRAIRWCLTNEPKGADFLRWGASKCSETIILDGQPTKLEYHTKVCLTFSDGSKLTRGRTDKSSGFYLVETSSGEAILFKGFSHNPPPDIYNVSQMPKIALAKGAERSLNIQTQHEGAFLLSDEASVRAAAIGRLTGVQVVDAAIKELSKDIGNAQREVKSKQRDRERLAGELAGYLDLEAEHDALTKAEATLALAKVADEEAQLLTEAEADLYDLRGDMAATHGALTHASAQLAAEPLIVSLATVSADIRLIQENEVELAAISRAKAEASSHERQYQSALAGEPLVKAARDLQATLTDLNTYRQELAQVRSERRQLGARLAEFGRAHAAEAVLAEAKAISQELTEVVYLVAECDEVRRSICKGKDYMAAKDAELGALLAEYAEALKAMGRCPTCSSPVTEHVLEDILAHHQHQEAQHGHQA